jgi:hypothetical protein
LLPLIAALQTREVLLINEFETYGYRRVGGALRQAGMIVNHKRSV